MSQVQIECQGLPCPQPVIKCKETIEQQSPNSISVLVDNQAAKENVSRFLAMQGYSTSTTQKGNSINIVGTRNDAESSDDSVCETMSNKDLSIVAHKNLVFVASDVIGSGDDELGAKLMYNFLLTLKEMGSDLWRIVMVNGGVKLSAEGNPCAEPLQLLEKNGVSILVCGTCLEHFGLTDSRKVGEITNMLDIVTSFQLASQTIRV